MAAFLIPASSHPVPRTNLDLMPTCGKQPSGAFARLSRESGCGGPLVPIMLTVASWLRTGYRQKRGGRVPCKVNVTTNSLECKVSINAVLKKQCEATGASYVIHWVKAGDNRYVMASSYEDPEYLKTLSRIRGDDLTMVKMCEGVHCMESPLLKEATSSGDPLFVADTNLCKCTDMRSWSEFFLIKTVCFVPIKGGVYEYGSKSQWDLPPQQILSFAEHAAKKTA